MFGFFRSKKKQPLADDAAVEIYGDRPPQRRADLAAAIDLAYVSLLREQIPRTDVERLTTNLFNGPVPFSTQDLAASTALAFFQEPKYFPILTDCQLEARACVLEWLRAREITPAIAIVFEEALYRDYKPRP